MERNERFLYVVMGIVILEFLGLGLAEDGVIRALRGFVRLQTSPARLLNDFASWGGVGGAFLNAAFVGIFGLLLIRWSGVLLAGPTMAAVFTLMGFALFGKTILNIAPIILGVYFSSLLMRKPFKSYILFALFGTALGPLTTYLIFELGLPLPLSAILGVGASMLVGMLIPPVGVALLHLHQGYNLYNIGFTSGFLGLFIASILDSADSLLPLGVRLLEDPPLAMVLLVPLLSLTLVLAGLIFSRTGVFRELRSIQSIPGRLPSDFVTMVAPGGSLMNMGLLGLASAAYVWVVGGAFNGPVLGGMLTVIGFGAFGKTLRNSWPVVLGVWVSSLVFGYDPASAGPLLAALFGTTLAPLAGQFGPLVGFTAGFMHLVVVSRTGFWHGGFALYNNGFAGGLTASLLVAIMEWFKTHREERKSS